MFLGLEYRQTFISKEEQADKGSRSRAWTVRACLWIGHLAVTRVSISSDGCALLFYCFMEIIISIVLLVTSILQIILFFKVWGMTNDIRELKDDYFSEKVESENDEPNEVTNLRYSLLLGDKEQVKAFLIKRFMVSVQSYFDGMTINTIDKKQKPITNLVDQLAKEFKTFNIELPDTIKNMKTFDDYLNLGKI